MGDPREVRTPPASGDMWGQQPSVCVSPRTIRTELSPLFEVAMETRMGSMSHLDVVLVVRAGTTFYVSLCDRTTHRTAISYSHSALINIRELITSKSILSSPVLIPESQANISSCPVVLFS